MMQSIFSPAARRTILEQNGKFSAATVGQKCIELNRSTQLGSMGIESGIQGGEEAIRWGKNVKLPVRVAVANHVPPDQGVELRDRQNDATICRIVRRHFSWSFTNNQPCPPHRFEV